MPYDHYLIGCHERSTYVGGCLRPTDGGSLRHPRLCAKAGRKAMSRASDDAGVAGIEEWRP